MTGQLGNKPSFGYPNQMGRIILHVTQNMISPDEYNRLLEEAGLTQYIDHPPAGDLEHGFLFESVSALQVAAESIYGVEAGREFNRKVGRACLEGGLREFNPLLGIADLPARVLPLGLKLHVGFDMFAMVFNRFTDQVVTLSENEKSYQWVIERCPVCWGRHTDGPCCHLAVGILESGLRWASGGREFQVVETQCVAMGADACVIEIPKRPLQN
jgi:predicted hydrocarbon binding protein